MASERFRRQLNQEGTQWQTEGLISPEQWQQLRDRYQIDNLEQDSKNRFTLILMSVGCILIGLGMLTYVAANWQEIPRNVRVGMLFLLFIGVNFGGYQLWQSVRSVQQRLGQAILLLGGLLLGANITLLAQMFHIGGSAHPLFFNWGLAVWLMAYSLRQTPLGLLSIVLLGLGYWTGWWEVYWDLSSRYAEPSLYSVVMLNMPAIAALLFIPLAYRCRSRLLFTAACLGVGSALINSWHEYVLMDIPILAAIVLILPTALLWGYDDTLWADLLRQRLPLTQNPRPFQPIARVLGIVYLGQLLYFNSFYFSRLSFDLSWYAGNQQWLYFLPGFLLLTIVMVVQWVYLVRSELRSERRNANHRNNTLAIAGFLGAIGFICLLSTPTGHPWITFTINALLALLGIGLIRQSLENSRRAPFWYGLVLIVLQITSRMLEYETALMLKALIFILCGAGVILAGLWFEKYMQHHQAIAPQAPDTSIDS
ncbi:MAG: DUF2157 domain-containing protein [Synechococcales bacterium]|nr:DUF2157 domain-containing protein [Synechococcales bacterium]